MNLHACGAINAENLSIDPLAILRSEERDNAGDIEGLTDTPQGRPGGGILVNLLVGEGLAFGDVLAAHFVVHVGLDAAGSNTVDSDLLLASIWGSVSQWSRGVNDGLLTDGHAASESLDGALGSRVDSMLRNPLGLAGDGAHENDTATLRHALVRLLCNKELSAGVDIHDAVVLFLINVCEVAERNDARVGAADIQLAEVRHDLVHELCCLLGVGDIGLDGNGVGARLHGFDLLDDFLGSFGAVGVVHNDLCAATGKLESHLLANATAC